MSGYRRYSKINKNHQVNGKPPYAVYSAHSHNSPIMNNDNILVTSVDPGIKNCGIYVNCFNTKTKENTSVLLVRLDFSKGEDNHYISCIKQLDDFERNHECFSKSHYIVIESQMTISYDNTRMGQHLITYFTTKFKNRGNMPHVIEFNSQAKTRMLGCPKGMKKQQYKRWCKLKAIEILNGRDNKEHEINFSNKIKSATKADDMGDSVCQCHAWIMLLEGENKPLLPKKETGDFVIED
jgi:hypothetical protein